MGRINENVKIWNFNLGDFYTVITRPHLLKICQSVRLRKTRPGRGQVCAVDVHPHTAQRVRCRNTLDHARCTNNALNGCFDYIAKCTKRILYEGCFSSFCLLHTICRCGILVSSNKERATARKETSKWKILPCSRP